MREDLWMAFAREKVDVYGESDGVTVLDKGKVLILRQAGWDL